MSGGWIVNEVPPMLRGARLLLRSQLGYELRKAEDRFTRACVEKIVMGGTVVDSSGKQSSGKQSSEPSYPTDMYGSWLPPIMRDVFERAQVVGVGIKTFGELVAKGDFPGTGGFTVPMGAEGGEGEVPTREAAEGLESAKRVNSNGLTAEEERALLEAAEEVGVKPSTISSSSAEVVQNREEKVLGVPSAKFAVEKKQEKAKKSFYQPELPKGYKMSIPVADSSSLTNRERKVPSSRIARLARFSQLGLGLAAGAAAEVTRRTFTFNKVEASSSTADRVIGSGNPFMTTANAEKIVQTLCRVRGAALKLGQMLSIQDSETVSPVWLQIFERVRHSADFMPTSQVHRQLRRELGENWRDLLLSFDDKPFAAASIGQVHAGTLLDGRKVAIKIQYPGVAEGIDSDINNLVTVLHFGGIFPEGLFLENFIKVARRELKLECNYLREARAMREFGRLLAGDHHFYVPQVIDDLSTRRVLTAEYVEGVPVDKCVDEPQQVRDYIAGKFIELCLREVFVWRFMQTDPNWSNFFIGRHPRTGESRLILLDFGASRSYPKKFVDEYMQIIRAAYDNDKDKILDHSRKIGFLTGYESKVMEKAHCESIAILGETLASSAPYDFSKQDVTKRIHRLIPVMLEHRLTSPPEEIYSLHRKLSGSYLLATKLKAVVSCGPLFENIHGSYRFGDHGEADIDIDTEPEIEQPVLAV